MGGRIYLVPDSMPELRGLRVLRIGLLAAEEEGGEGAGGEGAHM